MRMVPAGLTHLSTAIHIQPGGSIGQVWEHGDDDPHDESVGDGEPDVAMEVVEDRQHQVSTRNAFAIYTPYLPWSTVTSLFQLFEDDIGCQCATHQKK